MNPERMITDLEAGARDLARRSNELRDRIRRATATQRSPDGVVTATVAPNGALQHIEFSPEAAEFSHVRLSELVMTTVRLAQAQAARQVASIVEPQFGGTPAMAFLTGAVPPAEQVEPVEQVAPAAQVEPVEPVEQVALAEKVEPVGPVELVEQVALAAQVEQVGLVEPVTELVDDDPPLPRSLWEPPDDRDIGTAAR